MSEEMNPTGEEITTAPVEPEASTPEVIAPAVSEPVAPPPSRPSAPEAPVVAQSSRPNRAEASAAAEGAATGPSEFAPAVGGGGRYRRTSVDARLEDVSYKNVTLLSRFLDPRGRILSRRKTRVSAKVQRRAVQAIKHARHLALLPYTSDQTRIVRRRR